IRYRNVTGVQTCALPIYVYIDGRELTHKNRTRLVQETTSMVFQQFNLYPHMTVLKNLTLAPIKLHHKSKAEAEQTAFHYLEVVRSEERRVGKEWRMRCGA